MNLRCIVSVAMTLLCVSMAFAQLEEEVLIAEFKPTSFDGWVYNRKGATLSTTYIADYNVSFFNEESMGNLSLTSPLIEFAGHSKVRVKFDWRTETYNQSYFSLYRASPMVEFVDTDGNVAVSAEYKLTTALRTTSVSIDVDLPSDGKMQFRLSAPQADVNNAGAVKKVQIFGIGQSGIDAVEDERAMVEAAGNGMLRITGAQGKSVTIVDLFSGREVVVIGRCSAVESVNLGRGLYACRIGTGCVKVMVR